MVRFLVYQRGGKSSGIQDRRQGLCMVQGRREGEGCKDGRQLGNRRNSPVASRTRQQAQLVEVHVRSMGRNGRAKINIATGWCLRLATSCSVNSGATPFGAARVVNHCACCLLLFIQIQFNYITYLLCRQQCRNAHGGWMLPARYPSRLPGLHLL